MKRLIAIAACASIIVTSVVACSSLIKGWTTLRFSRIAPTVKRNRIRPVEMTGQRNARRAATVT